MIGSRELVQRRLASQALVPRAPAREAVSAGGGLGALAATDVVRRMLAVQAQDFPQALWAVGCRSPGIARSDVLAALASGSVIRSAPMRGTLHFVAAGDIRWMLTVTAARTLAAAATRFRQLDLDQGTFDRARDVIVQALQGGGAVTRAEFMALMDGAGIPPTGQRGYMLIFYLTHIGVVCWGPPSGTQQCLVLLDEWVPATPMLARNDAVGEFVVRYLAGHAPATIRDFAWWSKLTLTDARAGLLAVRDRLTELECDGQSYWAVAGEIGTGETGADPTTDFPSTPTVLALPGFDEYLLGYQDRSVTLDPEFATAVAPGKNGIFLPIVVSDGRVVGTWRRVPAGGSATLRRVTLLPTPFEGQLTTDDAAGFDRAAGDYARFMAS